jgi:hypothetical protein
MKAYNISGIIHFFTNKFSRTSFDGYFHISISADIIVSFVRAETIRGASAA